MSTPATLWETLVATLSQASQYNKADTVAPVAVLWTDAARQWETLLPRLRTKLPILTLGPYDPAVRTGPAIWLRCMVARTLPEADWGEDVTPIIYLPGISRQELRAVEDCPRELQPLAELQYRGMLWTHKNGRDWTITGFLQSHDALQITTSADNATREALQRALLKLADEPVTSLRADAPLTATKLNALLNPEPVRNLLLWLDDPSGYKARQSDGEWAAFRAICREQFGFDPVTDGEVTAATLLGKRDGVWQGVWNRFAEAPLKYPALPALLRRARPTKIDSLFDEISSWPQDNEEAETLLRERLLGCKDLLPADARKQIAELENRHGERRTWVWAELGEAPLASILPALTTLANATLTPLGGVSPQDIAAAYVVGGWKADAAVLEALRVGGSAENVQAVKCAIRSLYEPWLRTGAEALQRAIQSRPLPAPPPPGKPVSPKSGCCWLFADGLRYDVGQILADALEQTGLKVARDWNWSALPGVTSTAKPAVSPVAPLLGPGTDFNAIVLEDGAKVTIDNLRRELIKAGYSILTKEEIGSTSGAAWTEHGSLDSTGHNQEWRLALRVPEEVKELVGRVKSLLDAGWDEIRIVTDHGWLLLPGGLPKAELPEHLTTIRKGRCARLKPSANTDQQIVPWHWDKEVRIAVPPGICCYVAGHEYEHGGISVQECVTPVLTVRGATPVAPPASISTIKWSGLRCRIQISSVSNELTVDLRTRPVDANSSIALAPRAVDAAGQASLAVPDDSNAGSAAVVVLLGANGNVIAQRQTIVGENDE